MKNKLIISRTPASIRERMTVYLLHKAIHIHGIYFSKREPWRLSTSDLLQYPSGSLGKAMGQFLYQEHLEPIPKLERHDAFHVLLNYNTNLKEEAGLYFFLFGNGKKSFFSMGTIIFAAIILPDYWPYLLQQYRRGKVTSPIYHFTFKNLLGSNLEILKRSIFRKKVL